jgi:hypothetical protein
MHEDFTNWANSELGYEAVLTGSVQDANKGSRNDVVCFLEPLIIFCSKSIVTN